MLIILKYGISAPVAIASIIAVIAMIIAMIWHCDGGPSDDYFPEI
jgi:hypothetical protein